jgi:hypothetical protein
MSRKYIQYEQDLDYKKCSQDNPNFMYVLRQLAETCSPVSK